MKLYRAVTENNDKIRFHTPGHGGKNFDNKIFAHAKYDITELSFSDNLQSPEGVIADAEKRAAEIYDTNAALFFSSGATTAVFTALQAVAEKCDKIYLHGAAHKSFKNGARLAGLQIIEENDVNNNAAVFVTSPDYFGVTVPEKELEILRKRCGLLVIDSAHGAHYNFSPLLPCSHVKLGDLVIMSPHKTLPVLTGGAILAVNDAELAKSCRKHRSDLHTTSPSYPVLASLDYALDYISQNGNALYDKLFITIEKAKLLLVENGFNFYENNDFTRLVLDLGDGAQHYASELNKRGIYHELQQDELLVFIITPQNAKYVARLAKELVKIKRNREK